MKDTEFTIKTKTLIDSLKSVCANFGLGNDGNEFKIITQIFLYKFLNDKFLFLAKSSNQNKKIEDYTNDEYKLLLIKLKTVRLQKEHLISHLAGKQNEQDFHKLFDDTLQAIAHENEDIFSISTEGGSKIKLFDQLSQYINDPAKRDNFSKALINKISEFSFEHVFTEKYDFFSVIFEYLIKDYNKDSGGKYAEYYTPHSISTIMAKILVKGHTQNVKCYDPSAGSGTLLMAIAHQIGEEKCTIYSQDISQKSSHLLRLNLILNNLDHSLQNIIQGNTILHPYHKDRQGFLAKFDYIVANPPFKLDFSDIHSQLSNGNNERFFAGIPSIPKEKKESMAIYLLFIQHILYSLNSTGKAAIVVPTGFITAQNGIEKKIREKLIENKWLKGVISMPSNIFATTGTNVSILFIDKENKDKVVLINASKLGQIVKEDKNQKTVLSKEDEEKIINIFKNKEIVEDFSVVLDYEEIKEKNYSFSAGQYFDVKIEYVDITQEEFEGKMNGYKKVLNGYFEESRVLEKEIEDNLERLEYE